MSDDFGQDKALEVFENWYERCLENGIEPEAVVERVGEMKLLVNMEQIERYENAEDG